MQRLLLCEHTSYYKQNSGINILFFDSLNVIFMLELTSNNIIRCLKIVTSVWLSFNRYMMEIFKHSAGGVYLLGDNDSIMYLTLLRITREAILYFFLFLRLRRKALVHFPIYEDKKFERFQ